LFEQAIYYFLFSRQQPFAGVGGCCGLIVTNPALWRNNLFKWVVSFQKGILYSAFADLCGLLTIPSLYFRYFCLILQPRKQHDQENVAAFTAVSIKLS